MANARRANPAFELFILGELMDEPHHGYLLRDILTRMLGPFRRVSWATVYPLLRQLEHTGLIAPEPLASAPNAEQVNDADEPDTHEAPARRRLRRGGPPPRRYRLTDAGRQRFLALLLTPDEYNADYPELFTIKLLYAQFLAPEQQRALLTQGLGYFTQLRDHIRHVFTAQSTTAHLPPEQRAAIWRMNRFRLASAEAQAQWIESELARLAAPTTDAGAGPG